MPPIRMLTLASLNFFTIGLIAAILGPALPNLAQQTGSPLAAVGGVISALFLGALIAQIIGGPLNDRLGAALLMRAGLGIAAVGMAGLASSHALWLTLASGVVIGLGHGTVDISTSVLVSVAAGARNVMALNLINVFFGAGAVAGPALASVTLNVWHTALPVIWFGAALALVLLPCMIWLPPLPPQHAAHPDQHAAPALSWGLPTLWLLGGIFFLYVGLENGMSGWLSVFVQHTTSAGLGTGPLIASSFWLALTGSRILATFFGSRLTPQGLLSLGLLVIFVGAALMAAGTGSLGITIVATVLMGLGCGPVFPTALALTTDSFPQRPGLAASIVIGLGSIGGIIIPWVQGQLLTRDNARFSMVFITILAIAMIILSWQAAARHVAARAS